jgi:hypothetical protein
MDKRVVAVGNSLAVTIDKPFRKMLNIGRDTVLKMTTDGRRIILEPVGKQPPPPAMMLDARSVIDELQERGLGEAEMVALHHDPTMKRVARYIGWLTLVDVNGPNEVEAKTLQRFAQCLEELRAGKDWPEAIAAATTSVPA